MTLDKITHFLAGSVMALALGYVLPPVFGVLAALLAGAIKEIYDHCRPDAHIADVMDFVATAAGGCAASLFVFGIKEF